MDSCDFTALFDHAFCINSCSLYFAADRSVNDRCDLFDDFLEISAFFGDQGWVRCNAADNAHVICFSDIFYIRCVNKEFHNFTSWGLSPLII